MSYNGYDEPSRGKVVLWAIIGVVVVVILVVGGFALNTIWKRGTNEIRGETAAQERVVANANYRISSEQGFIDLCGAINTQGQNLKLLEPGSREAIATQATLNQLIADYNANAGNTSLRGQYLPDDYPESLDPDAKTCP